MEHYIAAHFGLTTSWAAKYCRLSLRKCVLTMPTTDSRLNVYIRAWTIPNSCDMIISAMSFVVSFFSSCLVQVACCADFFISIYKMFELWNTILCSLVDYYTNFRCFQKCSIRRSPYLMRLCQTDRSFNLQS